MDSQQKWEASVRNTDVDEIYLGFLASEFESLKFFAKHITGSDDSKKKIAYMFVYI